MAVDKLVDSTQLDSDLTDVADEIRTAGGTLLPLSFPDDYVVAIGDIGNTEIKTASGSIAHFEDALARKAQDLTVAIEPVQDLHGQTNPWPAGGSYNLLPQTDAGDETINGIRFQTDGSGAIHISGTASTNVQETAQKTFNIAEVTMPSADIYVHLMNNATNAKVSFFLWHNGQNVGGITLSEVNRIYKLSQLTSATIDQVTIVIANGQTVDIAFSPMLCLDNAVKPFLPYSNICPISGWTGANVTRTGKNLLDTKSGKSTATSSGITAVKNADGSYDVTGTASGVVNLWLRGGWSNTTPFMKLYAGRTYYIKDVTPYNGTSGISNTVNIGGSTTFTPSNDVFVTGIRATTPNGTTLNTVIHPYIGLVPYEEWQPFGDTYSITFPSEAGTVYGGTLDVTTGKLTVDMAKRILNGSEIWAGTPNSGWYTYDGNLKKLTSYVGHMMADTLPAGEPRENWLYGYSDLNNRYPNQNWIYYKNSNLDSAESAKAFFVANPTNVVYRLATPIVYDLSPTEVTTLLGTNNVWADTGDSTIQYIAPKAQIPSAQGVYF